MFDRIVKIGIEKQTNFLPYYTNSPWSIDEQFFIFFSQTITGGKPSLNKYILKTGKIQKIAELDFLECDNLDKQEQMMLCSVYNPESNQIFIPFKNLIVKLEITTGKASEFFCCDSSWSTGGPLCISKENNFICFGRYLYNHSGKFPVKNYIMVVKISNGEVLLEKEIPFWGNHFQFTSNGDQVLLAHEGPCMEISDRLNIFDISSGKFVNIYNQQKDKKGKLLEAVGHEKVFSDGIVAVRYPDSLLSSGILVVDPNKKSGQIVDYGDYWHCSASELGDKFIMDTMWWGNSKNKVEYESEIVIFEPATKVKTKIFRSKLGSARQIHHPHPQLNRLGNKALLINSSISNHECASSNIILIE